MRADWSWDRSARQYVQLYDEIRRRREADVKGDDILSILLAATDEDGRGLSDAELRDELMTAVTAGHETTATGLSWTFDLLLHHRAVLERLEASLAAGDAEYLDAVVKESLPLHDPAPGTVKRAGRRLALAVLPLLVAGCAPQAVTTEGRATHDAYNVFLIAAACVFGVVAVWLLWSIVAYRRRNDELPAQVSGSNKLELLWTAIPLALVLFLFVISIRAQNTVLSDPPARVTVDVTAFMWSWQFDYEGRIFATPIVNIQNAPAAPAPGAGLAGLSDLLGKSGVFKDITGLDANGSVFQRGKNGLGLREEPGLDVPGELQFLA